MNVVAYRTADERFLGLPGWPYEPRYVEQDGLRLHYVDEGDGAPILRLRHSIAMTTTCLRLGGA